MSLSPEVEHCTASQHRVGSYRRMSCWWYAMAFRWYGNTNIIRSLWKSHEVSISIYSLHVFAISYTVDCNHSTVDVASTVKWIKGGRRGVEWEWHSDEGDHSVTSVVRCGACHFWFTLKVTLRSLVTRQAKFLVWAQESLLQSFVKQVFVWFALVCLGLPCFFLGKISKLWDFMATSNEHGAYGNELDQPGAANWRWRRCSDVRCCQMLSDAG